MSKIVLIGDTHIGLGFPNNTDKWFKVHKEYFDNFLFPLLEKEIEEGDTIIHLGDLFDNRNVIPINLLNYTQGIIERLSSIAPFHIILGNHDLWTKSSSEINSIRIYRHIPNVFIYESPTMISQFGKSILMLPYIERTKDQIEILKEYKKADYSFCHSDLNGCKMHLNSIAHKNTDKIGVDSFKNYKNVYSGHIHISQKNKNFTFIGSIFEMDRNDIGNQKGIYILDLSNDTERFIPNKISPIHQKVYLLKEEDISLLDNLDSRSYIDLYISNSLLINNRKLRRKIEVMLETSSFSSVDYIDDIKDESITEGKKDVKSEDTNEIHLNLEYKEHIRDYISNQKYDNDKVKNGIIMEYDNIIKIYEDGYK